TRASGTRAQRLLPGDGAVDLRALALEALVETAPTGLAMLDCALRFVFLNERAAAVSGLPPAMHIGQTLGQVAPALAPLLEPLLPRVLRSGTAALDVDVVAPMPGEPERKQLLRVSLHPVRAGGRVVGVAAVTSDVTDRQTLVAQLEAERAQLEAV